MSDKIQYRVGPRGPAGRGIIVGEGLPPTDQDVLREFIVGSAWFDSDTGRLYGPLVKPDPASNDVTFGDTVIYDFATSGSGGGSDSAEPSGTNLVFTYADDITTFPITWSSPATSGNQIGTFDESGQIFTFSKDCAVVLSVEMQVNADADAVGIVRFVLSGTLAGNSPYLQQSNDSYSYEVHGIHTAPVWTTPPIIAAEGDTLSISCSSILSSGAVTNGAVALGIVEVSDAGGAGDGESGASIPVQDTPPDSPSVGGLWVDTSEDPLPGSVAASAVTATAIDRTHLFGGNVQTQIDATDAFFTELCGGGSTIKGDHVSVTQDDMGYSTLTSTVLDGVVNQADTKFAEIDAARASRVVLVANIFDTVSGSQAIPSWQVASGSAPGWLNMNDPAAPTVREGIYLLSVDVTYSGSATLNDAHTVIGGDDVGLQYGTKSGLYGHAAEHNISGVIQCSSLTTPVLLGIMAEGGEDTYDNAATLVITKIG